MSRRWLARFTMPGSGRESTAGRDLTGFVGILLGFVEKLPYQAPREAGMPHPLAEASSVTRFSFSLASVSAALSLADSRRSCRVASISRSASPANAKLASRLRVVDRPCSMRLVNVRRVVSSLTVRSTIRSARRCSPTHASRPSRNSRAAAIPPPHSSIATAMIAAARIAPGRSSCGRLGRRNRHRPRRRRGDGRLRRDLLAQRRQLGRRRPGLDDRLRPSKAPAARRLERRDRRPSSAAPASAVSWRALAWRSSGDFASPARARSPGSPEGRASPRRSRAAARSCARRSARCPSRA